MQTKDVIVLQHRLSQTSENIILIHVMTYPVVTQNTLVNNRLLHILLLSCCLQGIIANTCLGILGLSTKMYKNPCYFINIKNNSLCWEIYIRVLNSLRTICKESSTIVSTCWGICKYSF